MKNLFALAICLATFNVCAQEEIDTLTNTHEQVDNNIVEETVAAEMENVNEQQVVEPLSITLEQAKNILNSDEATDFLTEKGYTAEEAFDRLLAFFQENNDVDGVLFTINETTYFVKSAEFINANDDSRTATDMIEDSISND